MTEILTIKVVNTGGAKKARQFASFAATGGLAAICNVGSRMLLSRVMRYELAIAVAYIIGMLVAFLLARTLVFEASQQPWSHELARFTAVNLVSFAHVWLVSVALARYLLPWLHSSWHPESLAHLIGVASPLAFSYYAHKYFTFKPTHE